MNTNQCRLKGFIRVLLVPMMLTVSVLSCTGSLTDVLVDGLPIFQCPTAIPVAHATAPAGFPTTIPLPTVTPFIIQSPQSFYLDDPVHVGGILFRLSNVSTVSRNNFIAIWQLEVRNEGLTVYEFFPAGQMVISTLENGQTGQWGASEAAADEAGIPFRYESYRLNSGVTQIIQMAAYVPASTPKEFVYRLDLSSSSNSNVISWVNQTNPYC